MVEQPALPSALVGLVVRKKPPRAARYTGRPWIADCGARVSLDEWAAHQRDCGTCGEVPF